MDISERAEKIVNRAYDMFPMKHEADKYSDNCFPMYSFERAATIFWQGFVQELVKRGLTDNEIEWLLKSKEMRWMFDRDSEKLEQFAASLVTDDMLKTAQDEAE